MFKLVGKPLQIKNNINRFNCVKFFSSKGNSNGHGLTSQDVDSAGTRMKARQLLNQLEDESSRGSTAGPFGSGTINVGSNVGMKPEKKWNELSVGGKAIRAGRQSSRFTLILIGASVTSLLTYAIVTELFSPNSPTSIYNDACKLISNNDDIRRYMSNSKLSFYSQAPEYRNKHRNHNISHSYAFDAYGNEHLILKFYVYSNPPKDSDDISWLDYLKSLSLQDVAHNLRVKVQHVINPDLRFDNGKNEKQNQNQNQNSTSNSNSWFGALGKGINKLGHRQNRSPNSYYDSGEVYADLVKTPNGNKFDYNLLYVDLPSMSY